jgi:LysR family nitrogen assimilation transcriptional regulator
MEADFGTTLLIRSPQGVRTTEAGGILLRDAKSIIRQFEVTRQEIRGRDTNPHGTVCLGVTSTVSAVLGVPLLLELKRQHPRIKLRIAEGMTGHILEWLRDGRTDVGVLYRPVEEHGLTSSNVVSEELVLVSAAAAPDGCDFTDDDTVTMDRLATVPLILPSPGHGLRDLIESKFAKHRRGLNVVMDLDSHVCMKRLVEQRVAYSIMPASAVESARREGRLRRWRIEPAITRSIHLVHSNDRPLSGAAAAVLELCQSMLTSIVGECSGEQAVAHRFPSARATAHDRSVPVTPLS